MITPGDIASKHFDKAMSGYRTSDVDSFLSEVSGSMTQLGREIGSLKKKLEAAEAQIKTYRDDEDSIRLALLNAQRLAENIVKDANNRAELTLRDAEIKAERIIEKSKASVLSEQTEFDRIKDEVTKFRSSLLKMYKAHLEQIDELPVSRPDLAYYDEPAAADAPDAQPADTELQQAQPSGQPVESPVPEPAKAPEPIAAVQETFSQAAAAVSPAVPTEVAPAPAPEANTFVPAADEEQQAPIQQTEAEAAPVVPSEPREVRINLEFNEKTGEYLPISSRPDSSQRRDMRYMDDDYLSGRSKRQRK